jgi:hypothetical protein
MVCSFMCRGIKLYSIFGIHFPLSLEQVDLVFTTYYRANGRLGKVRPNPLDGNNGGRV